MYLVDGNNVMGQRVGWHRDKPAAQRRLLRELADLARRGSVPVSVVFDGRPLDEVTDGAAVDGVRVYFAGRLSNADDRMVELVTASTQCDSIVGVTSDRELISRLEQLGVTAMRSGRFRRLLEEPPE